MSSETKWWQSGVIYQIYPRSFKDSNDDGIGDLSGIESKLDYLKDLGVDAIWISPIFPSPNVDFGYDVADYRGIDPIFGSLEDFERLLAAAHSRDLKVLLDFVPNHSSDQHAWFKESRSSRTNPKRDWYIWRDAALDGGPPNNWISDFGGPAWEFHEATGQYYSHAFLKEQPDLNWRNPEVREAMNDVLRFWFEKGVDGFRIDVLWHMVKAADYRDNPLNPDYDPSMGEMFKVLQTNSTDQPEVHAIAKEMREIADEFGDRVLIGEIYLPYDRLMKYYGENLDGVHLPFNFRLINEKWSAQSISDLIREYEGALPEGGWPNWVLGNHDRARIAARVGLNQARNAAVLLLTLRGTPTMYYGDELGIGHVEIPRECVVDPRELREPGLNLGRDPERTPMPWDSTSNAGFSSAQPWLPLNSDYTARNVVSQSEGVHSELNLYRKLLALRRENKALAIGTIEVLMSDKDVLVFVRSHKGTNFLIALNFSDESRSISIPENRYGLDELLLSTSIYCVVEKQIPRSSNEVQLIGNEGVVYKLADTR